MFLARMQYICKTVSMSARMLYIWSSVLVSSNLYVVGFPAFKRV